MKRLVILLSLAALVAVGCNTQRQPTDGDGDVDADGDGDGDADGDVTEQCGDEREPLDIPPEPIVNGADTWDPEVVDLTDGQALAVGAMMSRADGSWTNACTATLVAPSLVLTAAHCVSDMWGGGIVSANQVRFAVGVDAASPVRTFDVAEVHRHPSYRSSMGGSAENDVAVLVLSQDATAELPEIQPIPMNCSPLTADLFVGQDVQNVGYGLTEPMDWWDPPPDNSLRYWTIEEVIELSSHEFQVDGHGISAVCNGDSGGPSLWTMPDGEIRVMGTVSWGDPSCVDVDHFARVDDNCDFLTSHLEGCGDVTAEGLCEGDRAVYCDGGALMEVDCAATGRSCGDAGDGRMRCLDAPDPCEGETLEGRCDGAVAIWCADEAVVTRDCDAEGLECGETDTGQLRCVGDEGLCDALGWEGECDDNDAIWCVDGEILRRRCGDCSQSCGWSDDVEAYYCL